MDKRSGEIVVNECSDDGAMDRSNGDGYVDKKSGDDAVISSSGDDALTKIVVRLQQAYPLGHIQH